MAHCTEHATYCAGCPACKHINRIKVAWYRRKISEGVQRSNADPGPVIDKINYCLSWGMSLNDIAKKLESHPYTIFRIHRGRRNYVFGETEKAIMELEPMFCRPRLGIDQLSPVGPSRMVKALLRRGFSIEAISAPINASKDRIRSLAYTEAQHVSSSLDERIRRLYEKLECEDAPPGAGTTRAQRRAELYGFAPPEAWTPETIDDPYQAAIPDGHIDPMELEIAAQALRRGDYATARQATPTRDARAKLAGLLADAGVPQREIGRLGDAQDPIDSAQYLLKRYHIIQEREQGKERVVRPTLVVVTGSRRATHPAYREVIWRELVEEVGGPDLHALINGAANGADRWAAHIARHYLRWPVMNVPADWSTCTPDCPPPGQHRRANDAGVGYCPSAGHRRNQSMIDQAVAIGARHPEVRIACVAFELEHSRGTDDCRRRAAAAGIPVRTVALRPVRDRK